MLIVTNPFLEREPLERNRVRLTLPGFDIKLEADRRILDILDGFSTPCLASDLNLPYRVSPPLIDQLLESFFLLNHEELDFLQHGFFRESSPTLGQPMTWSQLRARPDWDRCFGIIGVPVDLGGEFGGAREGPDILRGEVSGFNIALDGGASKTVVDYELNRKYDTSALSVYDFGNVVYNIGESLSTVGHRVSKLVAECVQRNMRPVILGGDHSLSWFAIRTLSKKYPEYGVVQFDAHHDFYELTRWQKHHVDHGNGFKFALTDDALKHLHQVGLRTIEGFEVEPYRRADDRVTFTSSLETDRSSPKQVFASLHMGRPYYLSFDLDCLDFPAYPETGTPIVGGLRYNKVLELVDYLSREYNIIGCDFVELSAKPQGPSLAGKIMARMILNIILNAHPAQQIRKAQ